MGIDKLGVDEMRVNQIYIHCVGGAINFALVGVIIQLIAALHAVVLIKCHD